MSCTPTPTATLYTTHTTFSSSTSFSQSTADNLQLTTIIVQTCIATGTVNGSSIGCVSTAQVTQVNTLGGGGQAAQVPIVVTVPFTETHPTQTLFASCGGAISPTSPASSTDTPLTTSILVQSTPPPTTVVESSSTTLADGSVLQTVVTLVTTLPPTSVYVPTSLASPALQTGSSKPSGTNVVPIVGGVLGGFIGLIAVVGTLWWLCRRRRVWDDIFDKDELRNEDAWAATVPRRRERDSRGFNSGADPKPYQYGLVGHVIPPVAVGEALGMSQYSSVSEHTVDVHSRSTSFSATPLLQNGPSRPSTAGSTQPLLNQPRPRVQSSVGNIEREPLSLSMVSLSSSTRPLLDSRSTSGPLSAWAPNMDELAVLEPLDRSGSPVSTSERRVLQIANDGPPSPTDTVIPRASTGRSPSVIMHTDAGRVLESSLAELDNNPPVYSR